MSRSATIRCLVPDFPSREQLQPWLALIDENRWYTNFGPLVQQFEQGVLQLLQKDQQSSLYLTTLSSATTALELAINALDLPTDSRVLIPALSFPATASALMRAGLNPVLADVDPARWTLTPEIARDALKEISFDAVIPVATFGYPVDVDAWELFALETEKTVLIDAAATFGKKQWSEHCHAVVSLHATKPFGVGEGGLFISQDSGLVERVRSLSNFGFIDDTVMHIGTNGKMSEYHAAVGLAQLQRWPQVQIERQQLWDNYRKALAPFDSQLRRSLLHDVDPPAVLSVQVPCSATMVADRLAGQGIETRRWYCPPLHQHPVFKGLHRYGGPGNKSLARTEALGDSLIGLPFHCQLSGEDIAAVCLALGEAIDQT